MATWMVHLRIADRLIDDISNLSYTEFVVGNIAPDSGVPNEDWSVFTPSGDVSHFKTADADGFKDIHLHEYVDNYYSAEQRRQYDTKQKSFYLGYLTHLLADMMWADHIVRPSKDRFIELYNKDKTIGFQNEYLDFFSIDAFDIRREYITGFYNGKRDNLEREYPYLTEDEMNCFVDNCSEKIAYIIEKEYL